MNSPFFVPTRAGDVPVECVKSPKKGSFLAYLDTLARPFFEARGSTPEVALMKLGRECFKQRFLLGLTGRVRLDAMRDAANRLEALALLPNPDPDQVLAWRLRARALGCQARAREGIDSWREELATRTEVVECYSRGLSRAGRIGRPGVRYPVVLADPPWLFGDRGTRLAPDYEGPARVTKVYDPLPLAEVLALGEDVRAVLADVALLFLWVPAALVAQDYHGRVSRAWGFKPKTLVPWVKLTSDGSRPRIGGGHYTRTVHEELSIATRGDADVCLEGDRLVICSRGRGNTLVQDRGVPGVIMAPRRAHSRKPDEQYDLVERLVGNVPRIELFARHRRAGWDAWGDEILLPHDEVQGLDQEQLSLDLPGGAQ